MPEQSESDAHGIVAERESHAATVIYTCRCGETIQCHPDLRDEAFAFHVAQVYPPGQTAGGHDA